MSLKKNSMTPNQLETITLFEKELDIKIPPNKGENIIYTDGSCEKNGKKDANAGLGIFVFSSIFCQVMPIKKRIERKVFTYRNKEYKYNPSNIRSEGYAIVYSMFLFKLLIIDNITLTFDTIIDTLNKHPLIDISKLKTKYTDQEFISSKKKKLEKITIDLYTDSQFWINVFTKWLPKWIIEDKILERKNIDIVLYGYYLLTILKQHNIHVVFHHVRAHQSGPNLDIHAKCNNIVDRIAAQANKPNSNYVFHKYHLN